MTSSRAITFFVAPIRIAEGLAMLFSLGFYYPSWELRFLIWNHKHENGGEG